MNRAGWTLLLVAAVQGQENFDTFRTSRLVAVIGNNEATGEHRAGYNGIFRLSAPGSNESVYVPAFAGLNLEHYFDARLNANDRNVFFEPRVAPMKFRKVSATTAELTQAATPVYGVESRTVFELKDPYFIDITYRATPRKADLQGGYLGIFWASYINGPLDKSIYFLQSAKQWVQFSTQVHGRDSTVLPAGDVQALTAGPDPNTLFRNISPLRYAEPFYYGRFGDMVLIYVFRPNPHLRFAHSPSGGGRSVSGDDTNPAWDFQLVIPNPEVGKEYGLDMRVIYKPWAGRADVLREVRSYLSGAGL